MAQYAARDNAALDALLSAHRGASRPAYAVASTIWVKAGTAPVTDAEIYYFDGTNDILIATINESTNAITFATLGTAAVLNVGTSANNVVQLNGSAQLPAVDGSLLTGIGGTADQLARDMAMTAIILADETAGVQGPIFGDAFTSDSLATKTGATYDAVNDLYESTDQTATLSNDAFGGSVVGSNATNASDGDDGTYAQVTTIPNWSGEADIDNRVIWRADLPSSVSISQIVARIAETVNSPGVFLAYSNDGGTNWTNYGAEITQAEMSATPTDFTRTATVTANAVGIVGKQINYGGSGNDFRIHEITVGLSGFENVTLRPSAITLTTADPSDVSLYAVIEEVGGADAGANVKVRCSIDNGSTYTTAAVADAEWPFTSDRLLRFDADVSGQTGSQLIWEITSENNQQFKFKEVRGVPINA